MKKIFITCAAILALFSSCTSVLDKEDLSSISEDKVWVDKTLTTAFLNAFTTVQRNFLRHDLN